MVNNSRFTYIDLAKGIAILLVLFQHLYCHYGVSGTISSIVVDVATSFHVPVFFFISGILFSRKNNFKAFIFNKWKKLIIPFLFFYFVSLSFVFSLLKFGFDIPYLRGISDIRIICDFWMNSCQWVNIPLWFFQSMFWATLFYYFITSCNKKLVQHLLFLSIIFLGCLMSINRFMLPMGISSACTCLAFMYAGTMYREWSECHRFKNVYIIILVVADFFLLIINQSFGWMLNEFDNPFVAVASGAIGSILLVELCKRVRTISLLKFCG